MDISTLSSQSLKDLHTLIAETVVADDALPENQKKWGVRTYPDWKRQADEFESAMVRRELPFTPINWTQKTSAPGKAGL